MTAPVEPPKHAFFAALARALNAGQSRSIVLHGNVHDLFFASTPADPAGSYVPLVQFLADKCAVPGLIVLVYELNGPIRARHLPDVDRLKAAWVAWQAGLDPDALVLASIADRGKQRQREALASEFDANVRDAIGKPTVALEFLRQLTALSRTLAPNGRPYLPENLLVVIEAADMVVPAGNGDVASLAPPDRQRVAILQDWFSDPGFMRGADGVVLLSESVALLHPRVAKLPSVLALEVPAPDEASRRHAIEFYLAGKDHAAPHATIGAEPAPTPVKLWAGPAELARLTAGLSVHALRQLIVAAAHDGRTLAPDDVIAKVESHITSQLGEDVVEFSKPTHTLDDVVGCTRLKAFLKDELIPRFRATGAEALPGAAVAGPIGGGKTFVFEAAAASLDLPVLTLKNIRSQWYGQTDVIFERLRRVLEALGKVVIVVDEADTQFGGVGEGAHETERRLTGKIQQMMSDPRLRGKVIWLLMTARIHLLSADIRRPGRVGDLIIPVLDPEGEDREAFVRWTLRGLIAKDGKGDAMFDATVAELSKLTEGYSAAAFASLRSSLKAKAGARVTLTPDDLRAVVHDHIPPNIGQARRYQTLQALVNCTRRSLLPDPNVSDAQREQWHAELRRLEAMGVR